MRKAFLFVSVALLLNSCIIIEPPENLTLYDTSFSTVTYVKNTLDYSVLVQCYFRPFNDDSLWCENELVEYSEPVEIQPNESKIVMDYVSPYGIKIFRGSDNTLLFENFELRTNPINVTLPKGILSFSAEGTQNFGTVRSEQIVPIAWQKAMPDGYFIQNDRYLFENVPWSLYPIHFEFRDCHTHMMDDDIRKSLYQEIANGYALVNCIVFNKDAECFSGN
jgi:hypothetical protein